MPHHPCTTSRLRLALWLALAVLSFPAAADTPADTAVAYLIDVARGKVSLTPGTGTAIIDTSPAKLEQITTRLERLAEPLRLGTLQPVATKIDEPLAAVLIAQNVEYDPNKLRIHAVALLKRDEQWLPAPLPASFENTGITYLPDLAAKAAALERWMLDERAAQTEQLRSNVQRDLLADIRKTTSREHLITAPPETIVNDFLAAHLRGDLPTALACLGGLEDPLPESWNRTLTATAAAFHSPAASTAAWQSLAKSHILRAVVSIDSDDQQAIISLATLDPFQSLTGRPDIKVIHFPLQRSPDRLWRMRLPTWLTDEDQAPAFNDPIDADLAADFPEKLFHQYPPAPSPDPRTTLRAFMAALTGTDLTALLPHIAPAKPAETMTTLIRLMHFWRDLRGEQSVSPLSLDLKQDGDDACAFICRFDASTPEIRRDQIRTIHLLRSGTGWLVSPWIDEKDVSRPTPPALGQWITDSLDRDETAWLTSMGLSAILKTIPKPPAAEKATTREIIEAWHDAVISDDPKRMLQTTVALDDDAGTRKLLSGIAYELNDKSSIRILEIHRHGRWAAATTLHTPLNGSEAPYHLLYPVLLTPSGPRILLEATLFHASNRSRTFRNAAVWSRLADTLPADAVDELKSIYDQHRSLAEGDTDHPTDPE